MDARKEPNAHEFVGATYGYSKSVWAQVGANPVTGEEMITMRGIPGSTPPAPLASALQ
jgi:hypothetical protein